MLQRFCVTFKLSFIGVYALDNWSQLLCFIEPWHVRISCSSTAYGTSGRSYFVELYHVATQLCYQSRLFFNYIIHNSWLVLCSYWFLQTSLCVFYSLLEWSWLWTAIILYIYFGLIYVNLSVMYFSNCILFESNVRSPVNSCNKTTGAESDIFKSVQSIFCV